MYQVPDELAAALSRIAEYRQRISAEIAQRKQEALDRWAQLNKKYCE